MDCEDYQALLSAYLDGETGPGEASQLDVHLDQCVQCRNWLNQAAKGTALARLNRTEPWPDISAAVMARLYTTN